MKKLLLLFVTVCCILGCKDQSDFVPSKPPLIHPPIFAYGDQIKIGESIGIVTGIQKDIDQAKNWQVGWVYEILFQDARKITYDEEKLRLYRRMNWDVIDLSEEPVLEKSAAEIENEDAIP